MGGIESDYSVCPRPFLQFLQFRTVRLHQFTLEGQDVELDNIGKIFTDLPEAEY